MRSALFAFLFLVLVFSANAQNRVMAVQDDVILGDTVKIKRNAGKYYDPRKAARRSAIIPGWGQIYNDSWWKVPVLYGGFGVAVYFVFLNDQYFHEFKTLLAQENSKDPQDRNENLIRTYSRKADTWRNNRDLVVLTMVGIYGLQIIDATVDAHLKGFNVDEDLALNLKPKFGVISNGTPFIGFKLTLPIGQ